MVRNIVLALGLSVLITGAATAQIVPATPQVEPQPPAPQPGGGGIIPGKPPADSTAETELDREFKAFFIGKWAVTLPSTQVPPGWTVTTEYSYAADGTFFGRQVSISQIGRSETTGSGTWTLKAMDRSNFQLSLVFTTPPGTAPSSDTLTMTDQNTVYSARLKTSVTRVP
jgi:hypothetical protein